MSGEQIVRYCSPTLAGIKTGNMFSCEFESEASMRNSIREWNIRFTKKGVRVLPLKYSKKRGLIYIYRPSQLFEDLKDETACELLAERGYCLNSCEKCIISLMDKLKMSSEFPHEIGLFLGYPPEDVKGFINNLPCKYSDLWKVYGDVEVAKKTFAKYKSCTDVYTKNYASESDIDKLTVAC